MRSFHLFSLLILLIFSACKNKEDVKIAVPIISTTGSFMLHLHTYIDSNEVEVYNNVYTTAAGRKVSLSLAQLYLSDIQLVKQDGSYADFTDIKVLKELDPETYLIGKIPVGNYTSIRFKVGLNDATDHSDPLTSPYSAILNRTEMWFSANAQPDGYVFVNVQGKIDTTADASGSIAQMQPFTYKFGTAYNYRQVTMPDKTFTILQDQLEIGHILIDYNKLFSGIQLNDFKNLSVMTPMDNNTTQGKAIANNITSMFFYEE